MPHKVWKLEVVLVDKAKFNSNRPAGGDEVALQGRKQEGQSKKHKLKDLDLILWKFFNAKLRSLNLKKSICTRTLTDGILDKCKTQTNFYPSVQNHSLYIYIYI